MSAMVIFSDVSGTPKMTRTTPATTNTSPSTSRNRKGSYNSMAERAVSVESRRFPLRTGRACSISRLNLISISRRWASGSFRKMTAIISLASTPTHPTGATMAAGA